MPFRHALTLTTILAVLALVACLSGFAQPIAPGPVLVNVKNVQDNAPVAGVQVTLGGRTCATTPEGTVTFDGVPAGEHTLTIAQLGWDHFTRPVDLAPGEREPVEVALSPVPPVRFTGLVTVTDGRPIAGARVKITPLQIASATRGPGEWTAGWDGKFTVLRVPPGMYSVEVSAAGCATGKFETDIQPEMEPPTYALEPEAEPGVFTVTVRDSVSGAPIAGAAVILAEAWPLGEVARGVTDGAGSVTLAGFQTGRLNWDVDDPIDTMLGTWWCDPSYFLTFEQDGGAVRGRFLPWEGEMQGDLSNEGRTFTGRWSETRMRGEPNVGGRIALNLSEDPWGFNGKHGYNEDEPNLGWSGSRVRTSNVPRCRSQLTVFVEGAAHEPTAVPVSLGDGQVDVRMNPNAVIEEQEPNNDIASAQPILTGAPVKAHFQPAGDRDHFRFRLPISARVRLETHTAGQWCRIFLFRPDGTAILEEGLTGGDAPRASECGQLPPGDYIVCFQEFSNNALVLDDVFFRVVCTWLPDPFEPNNTIHQARTIRSGEEVRGYISPHGDLDFYRFEVKRPSVVRFSTPRFNTMWRRVIVNNERGDELANWGHTSSGSGDIQLDPGVYYVRMMDFGNNGSSIEPYALKMEMIEDDQLDDSAQPEGRVASIRPLALGESVSATTYPTGDIDYYTLPIPSAGRVHARLVRTPDIWMRIKVLDGSGQVLAEAHATGDDPTEAVFEVGGPTTVYLRVSEFSDRGASSPNPYTVSAWMEPCDELELMGRNDTFETASPLELGEWVRGNIMPAGDDDCYQLQLDNAGVLRMEGMSPPLWTRLLLYDEKGNEIAQQSVTGHPYDWEVPLASGQYFLVIRDFNDNGRNPSPYSLRAVLKRVEPPEKEPLVSDAPRTLVAGEAHSFVIDQRGDKDFFVFDIAAEGKFRLTINRPNPLWIRAFLYDDRTGGQLAEWGITGGLDAELEAKGPTRYRLRIQDFNDNGATPEPGFVKFDTEDRPVAADAVTARANPFDPTMVEFSRAEVPNAGRAAAVRVDADSDGTPDIDIPMDAPASFRYPAEGLYRATALAEAGNGSTTRMPIWVEAIGPKERTGVYVRVDNPGEGQLVDKDEPARARAMSWAGAQIRNVVFSLDGQTIGTDYAAPFEAAIPWRDMVGEAHALTVTATDAKGTQATVKREFSVSEYFDLTPEDASVVSGNAVRVSWVGRDFGPTRVRYRPKGEEAWEEAVGESARDHAVLLAGLEAGQAYEFQPQGRGEPGPIRTVTRVKGLAFGRSRYGATINRDYDQRVPISVRNHAEQAMTVKLVCGKPADPDLLLGFVGEGSEGKPFSLEPGEEREFMLCFSAQDVCTPRHSFPVRISSDTGYSDEAEVAVDVRLPEVKLVWEELGPDEAGTGLRLKLTNAGDSLTDLALTCDEGLVVDPAVDHGVFPAGQSMEVMVRPVLYEGYTGVKGNVTASGLREPTAHPVELALKPGEQVYAVDLAPQDTGEMGADDDSDLMAARAMAGAWLNPNVVDWSARQSPKDTDGDGKPDRWSVVDDAEGMTWVGDDTDGNGEVDFVHADIGNDGQYDYSGMKTKDGWDRTNMLETWLEMDFKLPWSRDSYEKHDADIVMNGVAVGKLRDMIPEGNYTFKVPPTAIQFGADGSPSENTVEIRSTHLRGGHFVVTSNFQLNARLTNTRAFGIGTTREEAEAKVQADSSIVADKPDFALSSAEMRAEGELKGGAEVPITVPVRNLGAVPGYCVGVSLQLADPGQEPVEVDFKCFEYLPSSGSAPVRLVWTALPGEHRLRMVVDPEGTAQDANPDNNSAYLTVTATGDGAPPTIKVMEPADGASLRDPVVPLKVEATDDVRVARVSVSVDGGLWQPLGLVAGAYEAKALLQPGPHKLNFRAVDGSGAPATQTVSVTVNAQAPDVRIVEPAAGAKIDDRTATVKLACAAECVLVGARSNGGPWVTAKPAQGAAELTVPVSFGKNALEVFAANERGLKGSATTEVDCTRQRDADEPEPTPAAPTPAAPVPPAAGAGPVEATPVAAPATPAGPRRGFQGPAVAAAGGEQQTGVAPPAGQPGQAAPVAQPGPTPAGEREAEGIASGRGRKPAGPTTPTGPMPYISGNPVVDVDGIGPVDVSGAGNQVIPPAGAPLGAPAAGAAGEEEGEIEEEPLPEISPEDDAEWAALEDAPLDETESESDTYDGTGGDEILPDDIVPPPLETGVPGPDIATGPGFAWDCMTPPVNPPPGSDPGLLPPRPCARPRGGCICVQQRQSDWYCTNRPTVGVKFRLPDKLKNYGKHLKPGSKEFFEEMGKLMARLKSQGIDTAPIDKMWKIMRDKAGKLQTPEELPGWLESFGFSGAKKPTQADKDWQEGMRNAADAWMMKLLASGDPAMIAAGVKARMGAFGEFDKALQDSANAAITQIEANQKLTETAVNMLPGVGLVFDSVSYFGYNGESLSGDKVSAARLGFNALLTLGPIGIAKILQTPGGRAALASFGNKAALIGAAGEARLAQALGIEAGQITKGLKWVWNGLTKERHLWGNRAGNAMKANSITAIRQREAAQTAARLSRKVDEKLAGKLIDKLSKAGDRKEFRKLVAQLQQNKTAQAMINNPKIPDSLRLQINRTIKAQNRLVDSKTIKALRENDGVKKAMGHYATKLDCPEDQIFIRARDISGNNPAKVGRDRDVWYEICRKKPDGTIQRLQDVHHDIARPIYDSNLRSVTGKHMGGGPGGLGVDDLDHTITGKWNPETYNTGKVDPQRLVNKETGAIIGGAEAGDDAAAAVARELAGHADDLADTAKLKVLERLEKAKKLREAGRVMEAERELSEGMRQAVKEFDRHVQPYIDALAKAKGLTPAQARALIPPRLQTAIDQMRLVEQGLDAGGMAASEAEAVLNALNCSKGLSRAPVSTETIAGDLSSFIKMLYKYGLKTQ